MLVRFTYIDAYGRRITQTLTSTATTIPDAITAVGLFAPLMQAISDGGLEEVTFTSKSTASAYAVTAGANRDVAATMQLKTSVGYDYALKIPMVKSSLVEAGGGIDTSDADMLAYLNQFLTGGGWRLNNRTPVYMVQVVGGELDK